MRRVEATPCPKSRCQRLLAQSRYVIDDFPYEARRINISDFRITQKGCARVAFLHFDKLVCALRSHGSSQHDTIVAPSRLEFGNCELSPLGRRNFVAVEFAIERPDGPMTPDEALASKEHSR